MNYQVWRAEAERLLGELRRTDFGYPLGDNVVRPAVALNDSIAAQLAGLHSACAAKLDAFFSICDGISWPDVHNGYFIKQRKEIGQIKNEYDPTKIIGDMAGRIVVVGSSGAGTLFAIRTRIGDILALSSGRIDGNTYYDNGNVHVAAADFDGFAQLLLEDLRAFVAGKEEHTYVA